MFFKIFGINYQGLLKVYENQFILNHQYEELHKEITEAKQQAMEIASLTGGPGWTQTVQNAVMQLNNRLENMENVVVQHQQNLSVIAEERKQLEELTNQAPKSQLN